MRMSKLTGNLAVGLIMCQGSLAVLVRMQSSLQGAWGEDAFAGAQLDGHCGRGMLRPSQAGGEAQVVRYHLHHVHQVQASRALILLVLLLWQVF